ACVTLYPAYGGRDSGVVRESHRDVALRRDSGVGDCCRRRSDINRATADRGEPGVASDPKGETSGRVQCQDSDTQPVPGYAQYADVDATKPEVMDAAQGLNGDLSFGNKHCACLGLSRSLGQQAPSQRCARGCSPGAQ